VAAIGALQLGNLMLMFNGENVTAVQSAANAYSVLSCIYLVGMVLVWFAPETKGRSLQ
jgi:MFS transporter, SHS family, sialic acid transporter